MPATTNSARARSLGMLLALNLMGLWGVVGQTIGPATSSPGILRSNALRTLVIRRETARTNASTAARLELAKETFLFGDLAADSAERETIALEGIEATRAVLSETNVVAGNYYLALNLGQLARTRTLSALGLVKQMEQYFKEAIALDPSYEHAGPLRHLGELYLDAPGWPVSIGNRSNARTFIEKAVSTAPEYPENPLLYVEALVKWGEYAKARTENKALEALFAKVQPSYTGDQFAPIWADWRTRLAEVQQKLSQSPSP